MAHLAYITCCDVIKWNNTFLKIVIDSRWRHRKGAAIVISAEVYLKHKILFG